MIDYIPTLVTELKKIGLPVYYEMFVDSTTPTPCITYVEYSNVDYLVGDTLNYSNLVYQIKIWAKDMKTIQKNALLLDDTMKKQGFTREFTGQLSNNGMIQYITRYKAIAYELE